MTTIRDWTVGKSKNKQTPYVRVTFESYITWTGYLTPKTNENTMKALAVMGFKGANLGMLKHENALDTSIEYVAVIGEAREQKEYVYQDAKWINSNEIGGFKTPDADVMDDFDSFDTRAYIADAKEDNIPAANERFAPEADAAFTAENIPF